MCDNGRINEELTDDNDYSAICVGKSANGFRIMYCSGDGKPPRIEVEEWRENVGWYRVGFYYPKYCPNCGREINEYERF
jgi:hypothetical protein